MINLIVILTSAIMLALLLVWWRWPVFRVWIETPKYSMLRQECRFHDRDTERELAATLSSGASPHKSR
jgi:hypothetical protein